MVADKLKDLINDDDQLRMSYWELQKRVKLITTDPRFDTLAPRWFDRSGAHGAWQVYAAGRTILLRLQEIESDGCSINAALQQLLAEILESASAEEEIPESSSPQSSGPAAVMLQVELDTLRSERDDLRGQRDDLRFERDRLLGVIESMTLALPRPKDVSSIDAESEPTRPKRRLFDRLLHRD